MKTEYYKTSINIPDRKIWQEFKAKCVLQGKKPTKVLLELIKKYVKGE